MVVGIIRHSGRSLCTAQRGPHIRCAPGSSVSPVGRAVTAWVLWHCGKRPFLSGPPEEAQDHRSACWLRTALPSFRAHSQEGCLNVRTSGSRTRRARGAPAAPRPGPVSAAPRSCAAGEGERRESTTQGLRQPPGSLCVRDSHWTGGLSLPGGLHRTSGGSLSWRWGEEAWAVLL